MLAALFIPLNVPEQQTFATGRRSGFSDCLAAHFISETPAISDRTDAE
jgi:hypothetical protein